MVAIGVAMRRQVYMGLRVISRQTYILSSDQSLWHVFRLVTRWQDHASVPNIKEYAFEMSARFEDAWTILVQQNDDNRMTLLNESYFGITVQH